MTESPTMDEKAKLLAFIETLKESLKYDGIEFSRINLTTEEKIGLLKHMAFFSESILNLKQQIQEMET